MSMDQELIEEVRQLLLGTQCESLTRGDGYLQIRFARSNISITCAWRVSHLDQMAGSGSKPEDSEKVMQSLSRLQVSEVDVIGDFNDLRIRFDNGFLLETFADAGEYENWTIKGPDVQMVISGPRNLWSSF